MTFKKSYSEMGEVAPVKKGGLIGALCFSLLMSSTPTMGATPRPATRRRTTAQTQAQAQVAAQVAAESNVSDIKLNYFHSTWSTVLNRLAEQAGMTLVMEQPPEGHFSRRDQTLYELDGALKVINKELEPLGHRVIRKADYLIVVDVTALKTRYPRPTVPSADATNAQTKAGRAGNQPSVQTAEHQSGQAGQKAFDVRRTSDEQAALGEAAMIRLPVVPRYRKALDLAGMIYKAFKPHAELVDVGPEGLPAFRAYPPPIPGIDGKLVPNRQEGFSIGIDQQRNELVIEASPRQARATAQLIRRLDVPVDQEESAAHIVTTAHDTQHLAKVIQPEINRLLQTQQKRSQQPPPRTSLLRKKTPASMRLAQGAEATQDVDDPNQPLPPDPTDAALNPDVPATSTGNGEMSQELKDLLGGLKGEVSVESMPDLGVLILRGNQKDVDAVMAIINEIEKLSVGTAPDVHLVLLQHVNSEALADLMTRVYERLSTLRGRVIQQNQAATFFPVVKPNALLVISSANDMDAILKLASELDKPVDPRTEFQVFRLRSAVASQVQQLITEFYNERQGLGPRVIVTSDARTNSVIVQASPRDIDEVSAMIQGIDKNDSAAVSEMRIFPLKNAVADELASVIQTAIQSVLNPPRLGSGTGGLNNQIGNVGAGGQGSQNINEVKSQVLQFLSSSGGAGRLLRSGIIADIRINSDARTNSLLVTAPEESLPLLEELIRELDKPASTVAEIKVFSLANGDAAATAALLETLFIAEQAEERLGVQLVGAEDASSGLVPLKFSVDSRTNSIIAIGGAEALRVVEAILLRLDASDIRQRKSTVYRLKNSPATNVAEAINQFLTSRRELEQSGDGLVSPFEQIEREVIVVPETVSNSLLISATPRFFEEIRELVVKLDEAPAQVVIQALLVEVTLENTDEFGVELGFQDSVLFDRSVIDNLLTISETTTSQNGVQTTTQNIISQESSPGFLFNNQQLGNNTTVHPSKVGTQGLSNFSLGRVNNDLGYGGLVLAAGSEGVSVLLRALAARRRVDILSRPQIRTLDNQLALIQVGQQVPVVDGVSVTAVGSANPIVRQDDAGIILQVTPRISPEGLVVMEVQAEKSQFQPTDSGIPIFTDATSGNVIRAPIKDITTARATVSVRDEQTIVLGGMITKAGQRIERKVPWLGDVPYLGIPFRYEFTNSVRTELLIFLTPRVVRTDADSEMMKIIETERIHFMEQEAEAMHGPILSVPAEAGEFGPYPGEVPAWCPPGEGWVPQEDGEIPTTTVPPGTLQVPPPPVPPAPGLDGASTKRQPKKGLSALLFPWRKEAPKTSALDRKSSAAIRLPSPYSTTR